MFFQLSKFNRVSETNQTSNQNFPTPFFRERCQEDIAILIAFSSSEIARYIWKTLVFFTLVNKLSQSTIIKLSENIYFSRVCVNRPTVKRRRRMMVIWGTLIP